MLFALVVALTFVGATPASANTVYSFDYTGTGYNGSGTLDVNATGLIVGLTGTQNGNTMTLDAVNYFASNDNLFSNVAPYVTQNGFSFDVSGVSYNIYYAGTAGGYAFTGCDVSQTCVTHDAYGNPSVPVNFSASAPEPGTILLFTSGFLLVGLNRLRRRRT